MKRIAGLLVSGLMVAASVAVSGPAEAAPAKLVPATGKAIPNQYIVVLKEGANARAIAAAAEVSPKYVYEAALNGFAATLNAGQLNALQHHPDVSYVEQDGEATINTTQTVGFGQWGLDRIDQRYLPLDGTYTYTSTGAGIAAYIIDTGINYAHTEFGGRAAKAYDAFGGTGADCNGHGTYVAGIVGGTTYGVAKQVQLRSVRVLDCAGSGTWSGVIAGIDWVRVNAPKPAVAIISLGGSTSVDSAISSMASSNVSVSVPAGNNNGDACNYSPARANGVLTVAATDRSDTRAASSNYGPCVELYAPGANISSIGAAAANATTAAAAHVVGCAAKYLSANPGSGAYAANKWIIDNATVGVVKSNPVNTPNRLLYCPL